jgi:hypothetical protein
MQDLLRKRCESKIQKRTVAVKKKSARQVPLYKEIVQMCPVCNKLALLIGMDPMCVKVATHKQNKIEEAHAHWILNSGPFVVVRSGTCATKLI